MPDSTYVEIYMHTSVHISYIQRMYVDAVGCLVVRLSVLPFFFFWYYMLLCNKQEG